MVKEKYLQQVKDIVQNLPAGKDWQAFLFGSSLKKERFGDLDLGIMGQVTTDEISDLKELFQNSTLPYIVDVVNFNEVEPEFKNNIFNNQIIWIKR